MQLKALGGARSSEGDNLGPHITEQEFQGDSQNVESPRSRRLSYSSVVSGLTDMDSSFISDLDENSEIENENTETENVTNEPNGNQNPEWRVPMYMKVGGQLYLVTDTADEDLAERGQLDNTQSSDFFGVGIPV